MTSQHLFLCLSTGPEMSLRLREQIVWRLSNQATSCVSPCAAPLISFTEARGGSSQSQSTKLLPEKGLRSWQGRGELAGWEGQEGKLPHSMEKGKMTGYIPCHGSNLFKIKSICSFHTLCSTSLLQPTVD